MRDRDGVREECDRFRRQCASQPLPQYFLPRASGEITHIKGREESAETANGTISEQLSPETGVSGSDKLPHLSFSILYIQ